MLSEVARAVFPTGSAFPGALFYVVQLLTFAILILAANSAYQGFPRLASLLSRDRFLPREFGDLGDRLVYSNGAIVLAALAVALVVAVGADVERLIQLYVVGVFCAFTLPQAGMVRYWHRTHGRDLRDAPGLRWRRALALNALGACATGLVTALVIATKFVHGAWVVVVAMPLIVVALRRFHDRAVATDAELRRGAVEPLQEPVHNTVVLYVEDVDAASHEALACVHHLAEDAVEAIHVPGHGSGRDVRREWERLGDPLELTIVETDGRDPVDTVLDHVAALERPDGEHFVTVVIPELMRKATLLQPLRRQRATELRLRPLAEPGVVVTDVPVLDEPGSPLLAPEHINPEASAAFVFVAAADDAAVNALNYARALHAFPTHALHFALHPEHTEEVSRQWEGRNLPVPLEVVECPYRDLTEPLLERLHATTRHQDGIAAVILPQPIVGGRGRSVLHNRTALHLRWLLFFEPRVVLSSVPYRVR